MININGYKHYSRNENNKEWEALEMEKYQNEIKNLIFVFSKRVKDTQVHHTQIENVRDVEKIASVLSKLPQGKERKLNEIELRTNPRNWIQNLIAEYPSVEKEKMENLINDFTDNMKTRMREDEKYAIGIILSGELILCHSIFGEETITPAWEVIPRMLDPDNVIRYVSFKKEDNESFLVKYFEKHATDSFVEWLGLSQKDAFYHFGGKYRIYTEVGGLANIFELTDNEFEKWIEEHPEMKKSQIRLSTPIEILNITQIWVGRKKYANPGDFLQDYYAEKYSIKYYQEQFNEIIKSLDPYQYKFFDEKSSVIINKGDDVATKIEKRNPNFDILFSARNIEIRSSYLDDIFSRFVNGEKIRIFHAGELFSSTPLEIKSMEIWNILELNNLIQGIINYYHETNLQDKVLIRLMEFIIFTLLDSLNQNSHIHHFLEKFSNKFIEDIMIAGKITKLEDWVLEFKSREYFAGNDQEIAQKISEDLERKLKGSQYKVYLFGVEDDGSINFFPDTRVKSDRLEDIRQKIKQILPTIHLYLLPMKLSANQNLIILIGGL